MSALLMPMLLMAATLGRAEETSFRHVKAPNAKGQLKKAVLVFSDSEKAVTVHPTKGDAVTIPYGQIDKCSYEYKTEFSLGLSKSHWLEIDYREQEAHKVYLLNMDKHEYLRILDALKAHTGIDAEIVGNAEKGRGPRR